MVTVDETLLRDIRDRLIRLETLWEGTNQRLDDTNNRIDETNRRIDETNRRIDDLTQSVNQRIDDLTLSVNQRIDESNQSVNARIDTQTENLRREFRLDFNRQTFLILGFGAALIASVVTTAIFA